MYRDNLNSDDASASYLSKLTQAPLLNADQEKDLTRKAQAGCTRARERLIQSNLRLVISVARSYHSKAIPLEDLIQEGVIGLSQAIDRFDPNMNYRFSTYATHWIRQAVGRSIDRQAKTIRLPSHISQTLRKIEAVKQRMMAQTGYEPSPDDIARELGISSRRLKVLFQASHELLSLDMPVGDGENTTLGALIRDDHVINAENIVMNSETIEELYEVMMELNDRERRVMSRRLRVSESEVSSLRDELSEELQVSKERVRQIELQAIKKLRQLAQRRKLRELLIP